MSDHAPLLPPSGAPQWGNCSGSAIAQASVPDVETEANRIGTATHWAAAVALEVWKHPVTDGASVWTDCVGKAAPNGVVIDRDMADGAQVYVDDVLAVAQKHGGLRALMIEHKVHAPQIHAENWGTLDCAMWLPDDGLLYIWDAKFGHRNNRARENLQLINYAAGLVNELQIDGHAEQHITVVFRIVQPFSYHGDGPVNEWRCLLSDLRPYWNQLHAAATEVYANPTMSSGVWCRDCPAVGRCATARAAGYNLIDYTSQPYDIDTMTGAELATERAILTTGLAAVRARLDAIEADLHHRIAGGAADTGLVIQSTRGRVKWSIPTAQAVAFGVAFGVDISKPGAMTPTQAEKAAPTELRPAFKEALAAVTERPAGGTKLVDASESSVGAAFKQE